MSAPVAVITGANRGIGKDVAAQLHANGWIALIGSRDLDNGRQAARSIAANHDRLAAVQLDVTDPASIAAAAAHAAEQYGRIDALVNNAAILYDSSARAATADLGTVRRALETNLFGAWQTAQAFVPLLRRSEHPRIVNVSSEGGSITGMTGGTPAYRISKAALNALTRLLAGELRGDGILVNAVCPGWTATDMGGGGRPIADGAASVVWAVELPDNGPTGGFYRDGRPLPW